MDDIRYIKRQDLDVLKWDACIDNATNGLIYAYSFYLDAMCDNWDALVMGNYEAVIPLPWRKKWGIKYVYAPPFIQQLGVFSHTIAAPLIAVFLGQTEKQFRFGDYYFNYLNDRELKKQPNFILHLDKPYDTLYNGYKKDLKNNLVKAKLLSLQYKPTNDFAKAIHIYQHLYQHKMQNIKQDGFKRFETLCALLQQKDMLCIREVHDNSNRLLAIALCLKNKQRLYLIACSTTREGRRKKATHFLLDRMLHEFSNTSFIFDFEGSSLPGVQHFYRNFGSINQPYFFHHWNRLPWFIRLFK